jgi:hypothetical protein
MATALSRPAFYAAQTTTVRKVRTGRTALTGWSVLNPNTTAAYIQLFDTAGPVTLGTTVPDFVICLPASSGANVLDGTGILFENGLQLAATTAATNNTAPSTGLDISVLVT